jgi:hypothetical protein
VGQDTYLKKIVGVLVGCTAVYWVKCSQCEDASSPVSVVIGSFAMAMINVMIACFTDTLQTESLYVSALVIGIATIAASRAIKLFNEVDGQSLQTLEAYIELMLFAKTQALIAGIAVPPAYLMMIYICVMYIGRSLRGYTGNIMLHICSLLLSTSITNVLLQSLMMYNVIVTGLLCVTLVVILHMMVTLLNMGYDVRTLPALQRSL